MHRVRPSPRSRARAVSRLLFVLLLLAPPMLDAASLRPSGASMQRQIYQAGRHDFTYLRDGAHVRHFVNRGWLVRLSGNSDYTLKAVSYPYARPEVRTFVQRLSRQYRAACGERLVVTSLTRPRNRQPSNASRQSVHPTGMALDLRRSGKRRCRSWLEDTLIYLEARGVLEASYERWPPHYHVALFPEPYARYVAARTAKRYRVERGDSLWAIARRFGVSVPRLREANGLRSSTIRPGQVLSVPAS